MISNTISKITLLLAERTSQQMNGSWQTTIKDNNENICNSFLLDFEHVGDCVINCQEAFPAYGGQVHCKVAVSVSAPRYKDNIKSNSSSY